MNDDELLEQGLRQALKNGDMALAERIAKELEGENRPGYLASVIHGLAQGATLGFSDEIGGAMRAATSGIGEGYFDDFGERYKEGLAKERGMIQASAEANPKTQFMAEMGGGFALPGGVVGKAATTAAKGQGLGRGLMQAGKYSAAEGALAGYGYSEADPLTALASGDPQVEDKFMRAAVDVGIGAGTGATMGIGLPAAGGGIRRLARRVSMMFDKNKQGALTERVRREIAEAIEEDMRAGNYNSWQEVEAEINAIPGMTVADIGPATRAIADRLANINVEGGNRLLTFLRGRNREQFERFDAKLRSLIGDDNFAKAEKMAVEQTRKLAGDAYGAAYQQDVPVTREMAQIIHSPWGKRAMAVINDLRDQEGLPLFGMRPKKTVKKGDIQTTVDPKSGLPIIGQAADDVTEIVRLPEVGDMVNVRDLDSMLRGWDALVTQFYKDKPNIAGDAKRYRNLFREMLYESAPEYEAARKVFRTAKLDEEALDLGTKLFRNDQDVWLDVLDEMSDSEKTMFRIGALRAIKNKLKKKPDDADIAKGVMNNPYNREAIRLAFGEQRAWDDFVNFVSQESRMFDTFSQVAGNSKTAKRLMEIAGVSDPGSQLAALTGYALGLSAGGGIPPSIAGFLSKRAYQGIADPAGRVARMIQETSGRQADMLMQGANGPANMSKIMQAQQLGGLLNTDVPLLPTMAAPGVTGGLLGSSVDERDQALNEY